MFDLSFYSKNCNRYIYFLKCSKNKFHYTDIKDLQQLTFFFNVKDLVELNHNTILSCIFYFKYYFGVVPFFNNYKYIFKLNTNYFNFSIEYTFIKQNIYFPLYFFLNDIYYMINKLYLSCTKYIKKYLNYWEYCVSDMNFFLEKKNSLGFFNLKYNLFIQLFYKKNLEFNVLKNFKLKD